jgi:hypothetical protein
MPAVAAELDRCRLDDCMCGNEALEWATVAEARTWREPSGVLMRTSDTPLRMAVCSAGTHYWVPRDNPG